MHALATPLRDKHIVLCVGGGIAAYKSVLLLRELVKAGAQVQVAMTQAAQEFVGVLTFQTLSGQPVFTDIFDNAQDADIGHIRIADKADLLIVAPATANLMARMVAGRASDPVTAAVIASTCPVLLAPAMNVNMWTAAATIANVARLADRGFYFVGPDDGFLACQWTGSGRLSEPRDIVEAAARLLIPQDLQGKRVTISAGGTEEAIDPVRYIGNRSTGKMGYALALAAARRGAQVHLVSGPGCLEDRSGGKLTQVRSAAEMFDAICDASSESDLVIMAAAVADYRPAALATEKLKKASWGDSPSIELARTKDILAHLGSQGNSPFLVGFAAETENLMSAARGKLEKKKCDLMVANDVSRSDRGFGSDQNAVSLVWPKGSSELALASKESIAHSILDKVMELAKDLGIADKS